MTDSIALPGVMRRPPTPVVRRSPAPRFRVTQPTTRDDKMPDRLPLRIRMLRLAIPSQTGPVPGDHQGGFEGNARVALAAAVRQQLTHPGSVPPQRQMRLILADLGIDEDHRGLAATDGDQWNPFLESSDVNPHRLLAGMAGAPESPQPCPWWDGPLEDFNQ